MGSAKTAPLAVAAAVVLQGCGVLGLTCANGYLDDCPGNSVEEAYWDVRLAVPQTLTPLANVPSEGMVAYAGYTQLTTSYGVVQTERLHSSIDLEVDYDSGQVTGELTDFYTLYRAVGGSVAVEGGVLTGNGFSAALTGSISGNGFVPGNPGMASVDGTLTGQLRGAGADGISGSVSADLTYGDGVYGRLSGTAYLLTD